MGQLFADQTHHMEGRIDLPVKNLVQYAMPHFINECLQVHVHYPTVPSIIIIILSSCAFIRTVF